LLFQFQNIIRVKQTRGMKKKVILTKKRIRQLDMALSIDDILYERHRRMQQDLNRQIDNWYRSKQVVQVLDVSKKDFMLEKRIVREYRTPDGIIVEIR